jgi:hypothetical protein
MKMAPRLFRVRRLVAGILPLALLIVWPLAARADSGPTFSGRATAVSGSALGVPLTFSDTGFQSGSDFAAQASGPSVSVANPTGSGTLLSVETLHASTIGQGDRARSEASLANVTLSVAGNTVSASFLMARAMAVCTGSGPALSGSSELANVTINGQSIAVSGAPNQTVSVPPVTVYINKQSSTTNAIDVTALEVVVANPVGGAPLADVSFSRVHADVTCAGPPNCGTGKDFITGGGWIIPQSGSGKATFAVAGGIKNGAFWGHLEYIDHNTGLKVHGTGVTAYAVTGPTSRHIEGTADINGAAGTYKTDVADNGEPGRGVDTFAITLSTGYTASNTLGGGNIQLHQPCK